LGAIAAVPFGAGDGFIGMADNGQPGLSVPVGDYVTNVSGSTGHQTLTLHTAATASTTISVGRTALYRLPAALKFSVTTTMGSNSVIVTGGPFLLHSGDLIWSDAFSFGSTVLTAKGTVGSQTLTIDNKFLTAASNATVTHTAGSGQMWLIPAALKRRNQGYAQNMYTYGFPIGIQMSCSSAGGLNCTKSLDQNNGIEQSLAGRWTGGNSTGASSAIANEYARNQMWDIMEGGTVGTLYSGDNSNSGSMDAAAPIVGNCVNDNFSVFVGMYADNGYGNWTYCITGSQSTSQGSTWVSPQQGYPTDAYVQTVGLFTGGGQWTYSKASSGVPCVALDGSWFTFSFSSACTTLTRFGYQYNSGVDGWDILLGDAIGAPLERYTGPAYRGYSGDGKSYVMYPRGFLLSNQGNAVGKERLFDAGTASPSGSRHLQGDMRFKLNAAPGGYAGWVDTGSGPSFHPFGLIANDTAGTDYTMKTVRSGVSSNSDITGNIALSGGSATYNMTETYSSSPNCGVWDDTTPANAAYATVVVGTPTVLTLHGTGTDKVHWICIARN